jgi:hypothetical protein
LKHISQKKDIISVSTLYKICMSLDIMDIQSGKMTKKEKITSETKLKIENAEYEIDEQSLYNRKIAETTLLSPFFSSSSSLFLSEITFLKMKEQNMKAFWPYRYHENLTINTITILSY